MTDTGPALRTALGTDVAAIQACVEAAYRPYLDRMARPPAPMLDDYADLVGRGVVDIAIAAGRIVGVIVAWPESDHLYVDNIAVHPDAQGTGTGSALLGRVEETARAAGRTEIRLYTNEVMTENLEYYPRRGFVETHRAIDAGYRRVYFSKPV